MYNSLLYVISLSVTRFPVSKSSPQPPASLLCSSVRTTLQSTSPLSSKSPPLLSTSSQLPSSLTHHSSPISSKPPHAFSCISPKLPSMSMLPKSASMSPKLSPISPSMSPTPPMSSKASPMSPKLSALPPSMSLKPPTLSPSKSPPGSPELSTLSSSKSLPGSPELSTLSSSKSLPGSPELSTLSSSKSPRGSPELSTLSPSKLSFWSSKPPALLLFKSPSKSIQTPNTSSTLPKSSHQSPPVALIKLQIADPKLSTAKSITKHTKPRY